MFSPDKTTRSTVNTDQSDQIWHLIRQGCQASKSGQLNAARLTTRTQDLKLTQGLKGCMLVAIVAPYIIQDSNATWRGFTMTLPSCPRCQSPQSLQLGLTQIWERVISSPLTKSSSLGTTLTTSWLTLINCGTMISQFTTIHMNWTPQGQWESSSQTHAESHCSPWEWQSSTLACVTPPMTRWIPCHIWLSLPTPHGIHTQLWCQGA